MKRKIKEASSKQLASFSWYNERKRAWESEVYYIFKSQENINFQGFSCMRIKTFQPLEISYAALYNRVSG